MIKETADWHPADIIAALKKKGWTLRRLSQHHGYSPSLCRHALVKRYPNAERLIAEAIGVPPWEIWPSRYPDKKPGRDAPKEEHTSGTKKRNGYANLRK